MTFSLARVWFLAGPAVALAVAAGGVLALRRRGGGWAAAVAAVAVAAGWAVVGLWGGGSWRLVVWPRSMVEQLVLPAVVMGVAAALGKSRWVAFAAVWFGAWWLAGAATVGPEFWRVLFGSLLVLWALVRLGGREPGRAVAVGLCIAGAALVAGLDSWVGAGLVLAGGAVGVAVAGRGGVVPAGLAMLLVVGAEIGAGWLKRRGGAGVMDFACLGALGAPGLVPMVEGRLRRLGPRQAALVAPVLVAAVVVGAAAIAARVLRGR